MSAQFLSQLKSVSALVMDVDGVLTDGSLLITESGEQLRTMNIRDGYALQLAVKRGLQMFIITGGTSAGVIKRLAHLGIDRVYTGEENKAARLQSLSQAFGFDLNETIYIGDDVPDVGAMKMCGLPCCPADACNEVKAVSKYVSPMAGGRGCVRDIVEKTLKLQGKWTEEANPPSPEGNMR
jgi:3-deoxy-D-manno-octulosonate 8-phosphate phosphatase (KDO 8-P phosphatase)